MWTHFFENRALVTSHTQKIKNLVITDYYVMYSYKTGKYGT